MAEVTGSLNFEYSLGEGLRRQVLAVDAEGNEINLLPFAELVAAHLKEVGASDSIGTIPGLSVFCNQAYHEIFGSTSQEDRFSGGNLIAIGVMLGAYLNESFSGFKDETKAIEDEDIQVISKAISDSLEIKRGQIAERYRAMEVEAFYPLYQMLEARQQTEETDENLNSDER